MARIISAPFHPELEEALVTEVTSAKWESPLRPLAILVPSQQLARRVIWLLAVERRLTLLDVHVLTFHQLALTLLRESGEPLPVLVNTAFREELLRSLVAGGLTGTEGFQHLTRVQGMWSGLWATIQDLKEGRVEPQTVLTALEEGLIGKDNSEQFVALLRLYASVLETDCRLQTADPDDLAQLALAHVAESAFLHRLNQVYYYGFYDLTQGQLDFFKAIAQTYRTTVFFPLAAGNTNYRFAQQFFESYLAGAAGPDAKSIPEGRQVGSLAEEMRPEVRGTCRIYSVVGREDEVSTAAKEILRLIEEQQLEPHEIGVVARTLTPVLPCIRRIFAENRIPFACPTGEALLQEPLVKTVVQFIGLRSANFPRAAVMDILTSPFCRPVLLNHAGMTPHPQQWDWITRRLNITRGQGESIGDWRRLERAAQRDLDVSGDRENGSTQVLPREQVAMLWQLVQRLHADLWSLPARAGWEVYVARFLDLLPQWVDLASWNESGGNNRQERVELALRESLHAISTLGLLDEEVTLQEWTVHAIRVLERARLPAEWPDIAGVRVCDAMDARGLSFRALFIVGLNENIFPRSIQEDAFLHDPDRDVLSRDLGYKVPRKLDGFDEERLLFALLLRSARERLYLSYQRADAKGRSMAPSGYLIELQRACAPEVSINRRPLERWGSSPYAPALLTAREKTIALLVKNGGGAVNACLALRHLSELFDTSTAAASTIETSTSLTSHDGLVGQYLPRPVFSPTALQRYARCPFQYFATQVLRLEPLPDPESVMQLEARTRGQLCHAILGSFYQRLSNSGGELTDILPLDALQWLAEEASTVFQEFEETEAVGYPLLWELAKEEISALLQDFVLADLAELSESGYRPKYFEIGLKATLELLPSSEAPVELHGKLDRVDLKEEQATQHLRIVDYKYVQGNIQADDNNLLLATLRGKRLQPWLYLQLAHSLPSEKRVVLDSAGFYFLGPRLKDGPVHVKHLESSSCEGEMGLRIQKTLREIITGIHHGRFLILPSPDYCGHCDFGATCRVTHDPTRRRARTDPHAKALKEVRELKVNGPGTTTKRKNGHG